jgi:2-pyrone-4,6-dicarboxylate lactonase
MLFALHERLDIRHCVIVQPACHGTDNSVTADATMAAGQAYKGVGLVPLTISDAELKRLDASGFCGARFHYMTHLGKGPGINEVVTFAGRLADIGWHLQIHTEAELIAELTPALKRSPVPVVIDHMGRVDASLGLDHSYFRALLALLDDKNVWVKVSGSDRVTRQGPPYADAVPFARKLVADYGDRCVWGTDWPHPNHQGPIPDDGILVDILADIAPTETARRAPPSIIRSASIVLHRPAASRGRMSGARDRVAIVTVLAASALVGAMAAPLPYVLSKKAQRSLLSIATSTVW